MSYLAITRTKNQELNESLNYFTKAYPISDAWHEWIGHNYYKIEHKADYHQKFVHKVLSCAFEYPDNVLAEYEFTGDDGNTYFVDFVITDGFDRLVLAIELDGYAKMLGKGADYDDGKEAYKQSYQIFDNFLTRQNQVIKHVAPLLRYSNKYWCENAHAAINQIQTYYHHYLQRTHLAYNKDIIATLKHCFSTLPTKQDIEKLVKQDDTAMIYPHTGSVSPKLMEQLSELNHRLSVNAELDQQVTDKFRSVLHHAQGIYECAVEMRKTPLKLERFEMTLNKYLKNQPNIMQKDMLDTLKQIQSVFNDYESFEDIAVHSKINKFFYNVGVIVCGIIALIIAILIILGGIHIYTS